MRKLVRRVSQTLNASSSVSPPPTTLSSTSSSIFEWCPTVIDCTVEVDEKTEAKEKVAMEAVQFEETEQAEGEEASQESGDEETTIGIGLKDGQTSKEKEESLVGGQVKLLYAHDNSKQISFLDFKIGEFVAYGEGIVCTLFVAKG